MKKYFLKPIIVFALTATFLLAKSFNPSASAMSPVIDAEEIIRDIIAVVGLKPNFDVKAANIPNAAAVTYNGKRYIAYNPGFITNLNVKAGNKWASVSILAHEIGHHLNGHTLLNTGSQPLLELEADEFSGFVLQKMGATLAQAQVAMKMAASYKPSLTHPGQQDRLLAIAKGWNKATGDFGDMAKYNKPASPAPSTVYKRPTTIAIAGGQPRSQPGMRGNTPAKSPVLENRNIVARVNFPGDRTATYYVTDQFYFVKVVNSQVYVLGKMLATSSTQYPFVMKNRAGNLFVDRNGRIYTAAREFAGYLMRA